MNQQCKHIILIMEGDQVVGKSIGIYRDINAPKQFCDGG